MKGKRKYERKRIQREIRSLKRRTKKVVNPKLRANLKVELHQLQYILNALKQ